MYLLDKTRKREGKGEKLKTLKNYFKKRFKSTAVFTSETVEPEFVSKNFLSDFRGDVKTIKINFVLKSNVGRDKKTIKNLKYKINVWTKLPGTTSASFASIVFKKKIADAFLHYRVLTQKLIDVLWVHFVQLAFVPHILGLYIPFLFVSDPVVDQVSAVQASAFIGGLFRVLRHFRQPVSPAATQQNLKHTKGPQFRSTIRVHASTCLNSRWTCRRWPYRITNFRVGLQLKHFFFNCCWGTYFRFCRSRYTFFLGSLLRFYVIGYIFDSKF